LEGKKTNDKLFIPRAIMSEFLPTVTYEFQFLFFNIVENKFRSPFNFFFLGVSFAFCSCLNVFQRKWAEEAEILT
jgi:hypothetical protein